MKTTFTTIVGLLLATSCVVAEDWIMIDFPLTEDVTGISVPHPDTIHAVTLGGKHARSYDGGQNWWGLIVTAGSSLEDLDFPNGRLGIVCGSAGVLGLTHDGGESWRYANWPDTNATFVSARLLNADTALATGFVNQSGLFMAGLALRSTDGGTSWDRISIPGQAIGDLFVDEDGVAWCLSYGFLNRSENMGLTWTTTRTGDGKPGRTLAVAGNTAVMVGNAGLLGVSSDAAVTWIRKGLVDESLHLTCVEPVDDTVFFVGGTNSTLMKTTDGGRTWSQEELPVPFDVLDLDLCGDWLWATGSDGKIARSKVR